MLLYIDPGTGSMLFSLFIGLAAALTFAVRSLFLKLRFILSGGKADKNADSKNIPFVIFSDHKRYWNVFHALCDEFENHGVELTYYTASPDDPALSCPYKYVHAEYLGAKNKPYARMNMLHANIVISTTPGLDVYQWKRSRYVKWYVHIPHAVRSLYCYRMFGIDHYDAVLANGQAQIDTAKEIEDLRPNITKKEYVIVGSAVMDNLLAQKNGTSAPERSNRPVVLVAPSWGKSGILSKYGAVFLSALQNADYQIIIRPHPQSTIVEKNLLENLQKQFPQFEWNYDTDNFNVLNRANLLISDFSGTIFDFALGFDKPVLYTDVNFDVSPYDSAWINGKMWEFKVLPKIAIKIGQEDFSTLGEKIAHALNNSQLQKERDELRTECWANMGKSAQAEFDYIMKKSATLRGQND